MRANAVELSAASAWFLAEELGAGSYPWVLAITPPYSDVSARGPFEREQTEKLRGAGIMTAERTVDPAVARWIRRVCRPTQWLELRFVGSRGAVLRGVLARDGAGTVIALRSGGLITLTELDIDHPEALVPVVTAGLSGRAPARFDGFSLPARVGAKADEQIRKGAAVGGLLDYLGIPPSARPVVVAAFEDSRTYVEIVAGQHRDGHRVSTDVGVSVVDTVLGRVLVSPAKARDGEWISTFAPGDPVAIAAAVERLTAALPDGPWFPDHALTRDFDERTAERREERCHSPL
ncbi:MULTISPECIES: ESX secretion-associated protein EspG [Mycolicibacterium]|uniref:Putative DNA-binding protein n=2 Tax=Mycolicibacterium gilvum TaxID=1804 RepID=A0A378SEP1_9MYCO|nr:MULTISPECIES: ESX secretion-associated protein EspG [Mycolicibacterium]ABP42816.1 putative DNA-binding protein [Mycolicibacterium gilvum PYR-GCK]MBV5244675.1 ESX secretion-associated protein EspG [Mycolicibacterium sp. PAM1]MCV7055246.1 ESX secretion-associated protein EspG [Mycolicibacterium gilvum]STZ41203.1 putative DNA-binding protein [Mycolicibacterium gilvum]